MKEEFKEPILWEHQRKGVELSEVVGNSAFFFDPGLGKTLTFITICRKIYNKDRIVYSTLIVSPLITLMNWKNEWEKFSKIDPDRVLPLMGPTKKRIEKLNKAREKYKDQIIVVTNYEALVTKGGFFEALMDWNPTIVCLDEAHKIKAHNSKRTKKCLKLGDKAIHKFILTGTPILNSPMDIFSQFRFLDGGKSFGKNFYTFRNQYFYDKNASMPKDRYFPNWVVRPDTYEKMNDLIFKRALRAIKSECLDLPPLVQKTIEVELSPEQKKLYKAMEKDFIAFLEESDKTIVAQLAITKAIRMRQIISGFVKTDEDNEIIYLKETPRQKALEEMLELIAPNHKTIVWSVFVAEYDIIRKVCEKLKLKYVEVHGGVSSKEKFAAMDAFNNDPEVRVFIGHPLSAGIGVNLVSSSYSIYMSRNYSLEERDQSMARNYRKGSEQHETITHIDLVAPGTIDEVMMQSVENKVDIAEAILKWKDEKNKT